MAGLGVATLAEIRRMPDMVDTADAARILGKCELAVKLDALEGKIPHDTYRGQLVFHKTHLMQMRCMLSLVDDRLDVGVMPWLTY